MEERVDSVLYCGKARWRSKVNEPIIILAKIVDELDAWGHTTVVMNNRPQREARDVADFLTPERRTSRILQSGERRPAHLSKLRH